MTRIDSSSSRTRIRVRRVGASVMQPNVHCRGAIAKPSWLRSILHARDGVVAAPRRTDRDRRDFTVSGGDCPGDPTVHAKLVAAHRARPRAAVAGAGEREAAEVRAGW